MRRFLARFGEPVRSVHAPSWADFITTTPVFKLSVHTRRCTMTVAIAITMMMAGIISVTLECAVAGSVLLGGAVLMARYAV